MFAGRWTVPVVVGWIVFGSVFPCGVGCAKVVRGDSWRCVSVGGLDVVGTATELSLGDAAFDRKCRGGAAFGVVLGEVCLGLDTFGGWYG